MKKELHGGLGAEIEVDYHDPKAEQMKDFGMISNFMWRRAKFMLKDIIASNLKVVVLDPCAGGGKLLSKSNKEFEIVGYEPDYKNWFYGEKYLNQNNYQVAFINDCFESHFANFFSPSFHLVISIPYTDHIINNNLETEASELKNKNYAFYVISRSIDVLLNKGIAVFCIPKEYTQNEKYAKEIKGITNKSNILSIESYKEYAIIVLQKN